jgi:hypothetical protein
VLHRCCVSELILWLSLLFETVWLPVDSQGFPAPDLASAVSPSSQHPLGANSLPFSGLLLLSGRLVTCFFTSVHHGDPAGNSGFPFTSCPTICRAEYLHPKSCAISRGGRQHPAAPSHPKAHLSWILGPGRGLTQAVRPSLAFLGPRVWEVRAHSAAIWLAVNLTHSTKSHLTPLKKLEVGFSCVLVLKIENNDRIIKNRHLGLRLLIACGL